MSSLLKYFDDRNGQYPDSSVDNSLWWGRVLAGIDRYPFKGKTAPLLTQEEFETQVHDFCDYGVKTFNLAEAEDLATYRQIMDCCANGRYVRISHAEIYDTDIKNWRVKLEWAEPYRGVVNKKAAIQKGTANVTATADRARERNNPE